MALNISKVLFYSLLVYTTGARAMSDDGYFVLTKKTVTEVSKDVLNQEQLQLMEMEEILPLGIPDEKGILSNIQSFGQVIAVAKELVALGEDIYRLVDKGRPIVSTNYAPISVVPKINGDAVDVLETEGWQAPTKKTYEVKYENLYGIDVVTYRYSVIYSWGGSYNGKGAYLTAVQIIPERVNVLWGFNFSAGMKLGGLQNFGTKSNPVAGALILMDYTISNIFKSSTTVDSFQINGNGGFKEL